MSEWLHLDGLGETERQILHELAAVFRSVPVDTSALSKNFDQTLSRIIAVIPRPNPYNQTLGPFYNAQSVATWLGTTKQNVSKLRKQRKLLSLETDRGRVFFPSFQFGPNGELLPHLADVLAVLDEGPGGMIAKARWLNTAADEFDGATAADLLRSGRTNEVLQAARRDILALTQGGR